jgi:hypothetical protein
MLPATMEQKALGLFNLLRSCAGSVADRQDQKSSAVC